MQGKEALLICLLLFCTIAATERETIIEGQLT